MGSYSPSKGGVAKILADHPVPVIPLALHSLWGVTSPGSGAAMSKPFRRGWFNQVGLTAGDIIPPGPATPEALPRSREQAAGPRSAAIGCGRPALAWLT